MNLNALKDPLYRDLLENLNWVHDTEKMASTDLSNLKSKFEYYLENYSFVKEIETMASLYSDDSNRLKNMRLKILESLADKKLMDNIEYTIEKL